MASVRNWRIIIKQQDVARMLAGCENVVAFRWFSHIWTFLFVQLFVAYFWLRVLFHHIVSPVILLHTNTIFIISLTVTTLQSFKFWSLDFQLLQSVNVMWSSQSMWQLWCVFCSFIMPWQVSRHFQELRKRKKVDSISF